MLRSELVHSIRSKKSCLCVGLDTDPSRIPDHLSKDALQFNKAIIDATRPYCVAYKINSAFYEAMGARGWDIMQETISYIGEDHLIIADAKRGDIGNTAHQYAKAFFETLGADALTLNPYMGQDTVSPFLQYSDKWSIILACTSNPGAADFEKKKVGQRMLFEEVVHQAVQWGTADQIMFVAGATQIEELRSIRQLAKDYFLLVPGVGSQGGTVASVMEAAANKDVGLLINSSRSIIFAGDGPDFDKAAARAARDMQSSMEPFIAQ